MSRQLRMAVQVVQKSDEMGIIWGYASVADLEDLQGDTVPQEELVGAVYQFMQDYYAGQAAIGDNHESAAQAVLVESTFHFLAGRLRWYVGVKLLDVVLLDAARAGEISGFSIGGWAEDEEETNSKTKSAAGIYNTLPAVSENVLRRIASEGLTEELKSDPGVRALIAALKELPNGKTAES